MNCTLGSAGATGRDDRYSSTGGTGLALTLIEERLNPGAADRRQGTRQLHSYDASLDRALPAAVIRADSWEAVALVMQICHDSGAPMVIRGAGTGYSGGALSDKGVLVLTTKADSISDPNVDDLTLRAEAGALLGAIRLVASTRNLVYLPDPSSFDICTIGGNIAENAGGPHALGQGPTSNFVRHISAFIPGRGRMEFDETDVYFGRLDLRALLIGSEGTLGVVTHADLRLRRKPEASQILLATFADDLSAAQVVVDVLDAALLPSALDMLTGASLPPGMPEITDSTQLIMELVGRADEVAAQAALIAPIVRARGGTPELLEPTAFMARRAEMVRDKVRKVVSLSALPRYYLFDAVAPRSAMLDLLRVVRKAAHRRNMPLLNTFHAGDGNIHPAVFFEPASPDFAVRLREFLHEVLQACADLGGTLSGEHGIGLEKREFMPLFHSAEELAAMRAVKAAFDPRGVLNPGKMLPPPAGKPASTRRYRSRDGGTATAPVSLALGDGQLTVGTWQESFADVAAVLAGTGFELPWEPLWGGLDSGVLQAVDQAVPALRECRLMRARDLIVAAEIRRGDGSLICVGGKCAKDVSGYELRRLIYGARGRLGKLETVTFRVLPAVTAAAWVSAAMPDTDRALGCLTELSPLPWGCFGLLGTNDGELILEGRLETRHGTLSSPIAAAVAALGASAEVTPVRLSLLAVCWDTSSVPHARMSLVKP